MDVLKKSLAKEAVRQPRRSELNSPDCMDSAKREDRDRFAMPIHFIWMNGCASELPRTEGRGFLAADGHVRPREKNFVARWQTPQSLP
jgi:hypothetical protein